MTASWFETRLLRMLSNHSLVNIYNAEKFGLFYQEPPSKTMDIKKEKCVGGTFSKQILTRLAAGSKKS